jgi:hypothetical protein
MKLIQFPLINPFDPLMLLNTSMTMLNGMLF